MAQNNLNNPVVLITGASSGFGLLTAARLASKGFRVAASMRDPQKSPELLREVEKRMGVVDLFQLDVTHVQSIQNCVAAVLKKFGRIDVLINNAGYGIGGAFEDLTQEEIRAQMDVNFFGVQNVTREVIPVMRRQGRGKIINLSSVAGFSASPCFSAYNSSKWALEAFSESLRYELKPLGIQVLLVEPGTYRTKIFHDNARYAKNFNNPQSPYFALSQSLKNKVMDYVNSCTKDPETVAKLMEKLIRVKNPPFRNIPDREGRMLYFCRKILPFKIYSGLMEYFLIKAFRVQTKKS